MQMATCLASRKPTQGNRQMARFLRVCRGQRPWHVWRKTAGTWETPPAPRSASRRVRLPNRKRGWPMASGESDWSIVLRERESCLHGEGTNKHTQPAKETWSGLQDWRNHANLTAGNSRKGETGQALPVRQSLWNAEQIGIVLC